ncbi:hypothetical protein [Thermococcus henrietii]|uniref:hypothetical protein n=1 Tax=Thermococcus henrietii TaxID=2016361 RepID=UPI000C08CA62|nr:hypothetical protein [Thermococcus henrietii]
MTPHSAPAIYWYWYLPGTSPYSTAKSVDELLEWTEVLFDFDNVLKHHLPELRGHWIENPPLLTVVPRNISVLSTTVSFPLFLGNFIAGILYALGRENEFRKFIGGPGVKTPAGDGRMVPENILKPVGELPDWAGGTRLKVKLYVDMDFGAFDPTVHAVLLRSGNSLIWIFDNGRAYRMGAREFIELALGVLVEGKNSINALIERVNGRSSLARATVRHVERFVDALT